MSAARRTLGTLLAALLALVALTVGAGPVAAAPVRAGTASGLRLQVVDVSSAGLRPDYSPHPFTVTLRLTDTGDHALTDLSISAFRGDPITSGAVLDQQFRAPTSDPALRQVFPEVKSSLDVAAGGSTDISWTFTGDVPLDADLCLCHNAIYPLWFTASRVDPATGVATDLATTQTYLPSFTRVPAGLRVSWLWPLLDVPHRGGPRPTANADISDRVFLDDSLAREVAPGGRLDALLQVLEKVAPVVPMTVVVDPDLIDELAVMAQGPYRVRTPGSPAAVPGTGTAAAASWLARLRAVLPAVELAATPAGDPDVDSLVRHGMSWMPGLTGLGSAAQARVETALGGDLPVTDLAWPAGGAPARRTLTALAEHGTGTVVLPDRVFAGTTTPDAPGDALAPLGTRGGPLTAAVTSASIERWTTRVLDPGAATTPVSTTDAPGVTAATGIAALPELVATVAVHAVADPGHPHTVVITPPRQLTVDPATAERAISETAGTFWAHGEQLGAATTTGIATSHGALLHPRPSASLPPRALAGLRHVARLTERLQPMLTPAGNTTGPTGGTSSSGTSSSTPVPPSVTTSPATPTSTDTASVSPAGASSSPLAGGSSTPAASGASGSSTPPTSSAASSGGASTTAAPATPSGSSSSPGVAPPPDPAAIWLGSMPLAEQRCESSSLLGRPALVHACVGRLRGYLERLRTGVHLVTPATANYTLGSRRSSLPVTISNTLPFPVNVQVRVGTVGGVPGLRATTPAPTSIPAGTTSQVRVSTEVDRTGRIAVTVTLSVPPNGLVLGTPITLSVRSTALGTIGVVITVAAGLVLVLALVVRFLRRWRRRRAAGGAAA